MEQLNGTYTFLTEGLMMVAKYEEGVLVKSHGVTAKVEQVEMNHVKVTKGDKEEFLQLSDKVRWLPEEGGLQ